MILMAQTVLCNSEAPDARKKAIVYDMYEDYKKDFPSVKDLSPLDVMKRMEKEPVLFVDVREPAEMEVSMIQGAITKEAFLKDKLKYTNRTIVAYCTISYRSGLFAQEMEKQGFQIYNLKGGILAWVFEGGKVFDSNGETKRVHVYGEKWNYLPKGYAPVKFGFFERYF
jgi:rhodanese-related sulfurtransferase